MFTPPFPEFAINHPGHLHESPSAHAAFPALAGKDSRILGIEVVDRRNVSIGKVEDVAIHNRIAYLVLNLESIECLRGKRYAVPWKVMHFDRTTKVFALNLSQDEIERLPEFDNGVWPNLSDDATQQALSGSHEIKPF